MDALAVLGRREGRGVDGMTAGAALENDIVGCGFFIGEVVGGWQADSTLAERRGGGLAEDPGEDGADAAQPGGIYPCGVPAPGVLGVGWWHGLGEVEGLQAE